MSTSRRTMLAAALSSLAVLPAIAACTPRARPAGSPATGAAGAVGDPAAFPVTIRHKFGETVIEKAPTRVVCVGLTEQDTLLALGMVPVGVTDWFTDGTPGCIYPWAIDKLGGAELPAVLSNADGVQVEKIIALQPDLIIGQYAGLKEGEYEQLSRIAPTIAQPGEYVDYGVPWEEATRTVGRAIGKLAEADALVAGVNATVAKAAAEHKDVLAGKIGVVLTAYEGIWIYGPQDPRGRVLEQLGLTFPAKLANPDVKKFGWSVSGERAGDLADLDAVVWLATPDEVSQATGRVWDGTAAAKQGRGIHISTRTAKTYATAFSFVTALSIPYVLERYVPQLVAAIDGNPATVVPEVTV